MGIDTVRTVIHCIRISNRDVPRRESLPRMGKGAGELRRNQTGRLGRGTAFRRRQGAGRGGREFGADASPAHPLATANEHTGGRVLVVLAGLMRTFTDVFPAFKRVVIDANAKLEFHIVVATDLDQPCSRKDFHTSCCTHPLNQSAYPHARDHDRARLEAQIRATYAPYLADLISTPARSQESRV